MLNLRKNDNKMLLGKKKKIIRH